MPSKIALTFAVLLLAACQSTSTPEIIETVDATDQDAPLLTGVWPLEFACPAAGGTYVAPNLCFDADGNAFDPY